jgi:pyrimidine oxygenase
VQRLVVAAEKTGRDVGAYALFMIIADETDEVAQGKWELYKEGKDLGALSWMGAQAAQDDKADRSSTAVSMKRWWGPTRMSPRCWTSWRLCPA